MRSSRRGAGRRAERDRFDDLSSLAYLHMTPATEQHLVDVMAALALHGQHRTSIPDLMLAAIAHTHSAVVLHYDSGYERIAEVTGQPHEWILPRGTGHGAGVPS